MNDQRLSLLVDRHLDGQLTAEELGEFEGILRRSAEARRQFWQEARVHGLLHEVERGGAASAPARTRSALRHPAFLLAACAAAACLVLFAARQALTTTAEAPAERTTSAIAVLARTLDARWDAAAGTHADGEALAPGTLRLESGLAQVDFYNGVRLVLAGPVELRLVSAGRVELAAGSLSAEVPHVARGFAVRTPRLTVVDLGTAFGVVVDQAGEQVQVLHGRVTLQTATGPQLQLQAGEAMGVSGAGEPHAIPFTPAILPSTAALERQAGAAQDQRLQDWRTAAARADADPSLLLRFAFARDAITGRTMRNLSARRSEADDATIVGCAPAEGRWPGKEALAFANQNDRVRIGVPGGHHALTIVAWVRIDALEHPFNSLVMTDAFAPGALHWQVRGNGSLHLGLAAPPGQAPERFNFDSPGVFTAARLGGWTQVAMSYDGPARRMTQYVDGTPVGIFTLADDLALRLEHGELGNWNPGDSADNAPIRNLTGRMDGFALYARALGDQEIADLHRRGAP